MTIYRRFVAAFSGLNKIPGFHETSPASPKADVLYQLKPTDHFSKGQVVVAVTKPSPTDALSSQELHEQTLKALDRVRSLRR